MLTIYSMPKPFRGPFAIVQRNAIESWLRLHPAVEIVLFGDDEGITEICKEYGFRHEGGIPVWPSGTRAPLLDEVFRRVDVVARHRLICYTCADIILTSDLIKAVQMVSHFDRFLLTGRRYDLPIAEPLDYENLKWEMELRVRTIQPTPTKGMDYLVYYKGLWGEVPPFITGRPYPDSWLFYRARQLGVPVIDATQFILAVHQSHDIQGRGHTSEEIVWNRKLAGVGMSFNIGDATHILTPAGLRPRPHSRRSRLRAIDSAVLLRSPRLYRMLSLADYRRTGVFRYLLLAPWRMSLRAVRVALKGLGER